MSAARRATALACAFASAALLAAGCGSEPPATVSRSAFLLPLSAVRHLPAGSPQRSLLAWWRALQSGDRAGVRAALPRGAEGALANLPALASVGVRLRPSIVDVERHGRRAVVYTEMVVRRPIGTPRLAPAVRIPQAFALERRGGRWRLRDAYPLDRLVRAVLRTITRAGQG